MNRRAQIDQSPLRHANGCSILPEVTTNLGRSSATVTPAPEQHLTIHHLLTVPRAPTRTGKVEDRLADVFVDVDKASGADGRRMSMRPTGPANKVLNA